MIESIFTGVASNALHQLALIAAKKLDPDWAVLVVETAFPGGGAVAIEQWQFNDLQHWLRGEDPDDWVEDEVPPGVVTIAGSESLAIVWWEHLQAAMRAQLTEEELTLVEIHETTSATQQVVQQILEILQLVQTATSTSVFDLPLERAILSTAVGESQDGIELLWPRAAVVPYDDSDGLLDELTRWADDGTPFSVRQVVGCGGIGKTRLAVELCRRLGRRGWAAGFYSPAATDQTDDYELTKLSKFASPRMIVIDYSDSRTTQVREVIRGLYASKPQTRHRVRILLLGRTQAIYVTGQHDVDNLLRNMSTNELSAAFLGGIRSRVLYFESVVSAFRRAIEASGGDVNAVDGNPDLSDDHYSRPLFVEFAALSALKGGGLVSAHQLLREVIAIEDNHRWHRHNCPSALAVDSAIDQRWQLVAAASLLPSQRRQEQRLVVEFLRKDHVDETVDWLKGLYTNSQLLRRFERVQPDLLAEYLLTRIERPTATSDEGLNPDTPSALNSLDGDDTRVFAVRWWVDGGSLKTAADAARLFALTMSDFSTFAVEVRPIFSSALPEILRKVLEHVDSPLPGVDNGQLANYLDALAAIIRRDPQLAVGLPKFPEILPWYVADLDAEVWQARTTTFAVQIGSESDLAASLSNLGVARARQGRFDEALGAAQRATNLYTDLANADPDRYNPNLAMSLTNLGNRFSDAGRRDEALPPAEHAVSLYTKLANAQPDRYNGDLARALNNLGNRLGQIGSYNDALDAAQRATNLYTDLANADPDRYNPDLAMSLNGLGHRLHQIGRHKEALDAARQAVGLFTELANAKPDHYNPGLANALNSLSAAHVSQREHLEALVAARSATTLYTELANARPDRYNPNLAGALTNLSSALNDAGRHNEALNVAEHATTIFTELANTNPSRYSPDLAASLANACTALLALGRDDDAHVAAHQVVNLRKDLAAINPDRYNPDLARSLAALGRVLGGGGHHDAALKPFQQAVNLYTELANTNPDQHNTELANSLTNLGTALINLARYDDALKPTQQAVNLYIELANTNPDRYNADLAGTLRRLAYCHRELRQPRRAAEAQRRADRLS